MTNAVHQLLYVHVMLHCCNRYYYDGHHYHLQDYFGELLSERVTARPGLHTIIIDASSINDIDPTAVRSLLALTKHYQLDGVATFFANWKGEYKCNIGYCSMLCCYYCVAYRSMRSTAVIVSQ
jgi:STAS domain